MIEFLTGGGVMVIGVIIGFALSVPGRTGPQGYEGQAGNMGPPGKDGSDG